MVDQTFKLIQTIQSLGFLRAEVARILQCQCSDVGELFEGRSFLQQGTVAWGQAEIFIRFYDLLESMMGGDEVKMVHWLRARHPEFGDSPFYLIVDHDRLQDVVEWLGKRVC